MDYNEASSLSTLSVYSAQEHNMYLLNHHNIITRDISFSEMPVQHKKTTANIEQVGNGFQKLIPKAVLDSTHYATGATENLYHLYIATLYTRLDHGQKLNLHVS